MQQAKLQVAGAVDPHRGDAGVLQASSEGTLPNRVVEFEIDRRQGQAVLADQEDETWQAQLRRRLELELRVRLVRTAADRSTIAMSEDPDVNVGLRHHPDAVRGRFDVARGEV